MAKARAAVKISGRVQGVAFRHCTNREAKQHGISGWVRNNQDGTVEALFEGEEAAVRAVIDWCKQGPDAARVDSVHVSWQMSNNEYDSFSVLF